MNKARIANLALAATILATLSVIGNAELALGEQPLTDAGTASRFYRTVSFLQEADIEERAEFAKVALAELIAVYLAEADLARAEASGLEVEEKGKLLGWSQAVEHYANQLLLVLDDVEQGFPVFLRVDPQGTVTTTVADRAVILGHPRADQQAAYELRVLTDFCSLNNCQRMTAAPEAAEPIAVSAQQLNPLWTFTEDGHVCSSQGVEVHFHNAKNLAILRGLCEALLLELTNLAMNLSWQRRHGVTIEWGDLSIRATPGRPEHLVKLNAAGDSVLATLPILNASQALFPDIEPWLKARVDGSKRTVVLDAARYGWVEPVN